MARSGGRPSGARRRRRRNKRPGRLETRRRRQMPLRKQSNYLKGPNEPLLFAKARDGLSLQRQLENSTAATAFSESCTYSNAGRHLSLRLRRPLPASGESHASRCYARAKTGQSWFIYLTTRVRFESDRQNSLLSGHLSFAHFCERHVQRTIEPATESDVATTAQALPCSRPLDKPPYK